MARRLPIQNGRLYGALDANGQRIVNAGRPMSDNDVATKKYVDGVKAKDGLSAYEIAVRNGFTGTEAEWLESLKGRDGKGSDVEESSVNPGNAAMADIADKAYKADSASEAGNAAYAERAGSAENAKYADAAGSANTAETAKSAVHADSADSAGTADRANGALHADSADTATMDSARNNILTTYAKKEDVKNSTVVVTQGGVEKGRFTLNQDTEATIALDAGGGGGGGDAKCLLFVYHSGSQFQYVQWTGKDSEGKTHTYRVGRGSSSVELLVDDVVVASSSQDCCTMLVQVDGVLTLDDNGYGSDSMCVVDNARGATSGSIDTAGHHSVSVYFKECLEQSTPITMADGTTKPICELRVGDKVLSVNPDTMQVEEDEVSACDGGCVKMHNRADVWTFEDGTTLTTVNPHQFFSVRTGRMEYIEAFQIGDKVLKADGSTTPLAGRETKMGVFFHNTLYTKRFNNYFAGGILTGNRKSVKWGWLWRMNHGVE